MNSLERTGIIVLSGPTHEPGKLSPDTQSRFDLGFHLWQETGSSLILVGSSSNMMLDELGDLPNGPSEDEVYTEPRSRETVGNAIYSKTDILKPEGFVAANLVTADYHSPRATNIFRKVLGPDFKITPIEAAVNYSPPERRALQRQEIIFSMIARFAFLGYDPTSPGDDERVMARMSRIARSRYDS